jgi:hypothetical protein
MKPSNRLFLLAAISFTLFSCQKQIELDDPILPGGNPPGGNPGSNTGDIKGTYDFVNMTVYGSSSVTVSIPGFNQKIITNTDYVTDNNHGTVTIDATKILTSQISYTIDTSSIALYYSDGQLVDSLSAPFSYVQNPYGGNTTYRIISSDSVYMDKGFVDSPDGSGTQVPSIASGSKYKWSGDTLSFTTKFYQKKTQLVNGVTANIESSGTQILKMKKK